MRGRIDASEGKGREGGDVEENKKEGKREGQLKKTNENRQKD